MIWYLNETWNLADGGQDKITRKRSRHLLIGRRDNIILRLGGNVLQQCYWLFHLGLRGDAVQPYCICITKTFWWRTAKILSGASFETCLRGRGDTLMECCYYVLLRRRHNVPISCRGDVPLRRLGDVLPRSRLVFHLKFTCTGTNIETWLQRCHDLLLSDGLVIKTYMLFNLDIADNTILSCFLFFFLIID